MSKVTEVIKELQQRFKPDDDIVIQYWTKEDIENQFHAEGVMHKDKVLTAEQFSDLAEDIEHRTSWNLVSEYFCDMYDDRDDLPMSNDIYDKSTYINTLKA